MGRRNRTTGHRCRTNWKPAMERYFIDLMLEQVHRGNRMGHTFNKQAWNEMLVLFNANFGTPYDAYTFKGRYASLWKQFNDIKTLLDQKGFSWDNTRKMVIADKRAWAACIKVHPDAKLYRNKALPTFGDLCLIYAHTKADGRYSLSGHDTDFDDDIQALIDGARVNAPAPAPSPASKLHTNTDWKPAMDPFFLRLMLDQLEKGSKIGNTFKKQAWKDMVTLFNTKFGSQYRRKFLKQLYKKLLKYYTDVKGILATRGFHWDDRRKMIMAYDDVWDSYIKALPDARLYRKKPLLNYQDLNLIYGDEISNGICYPFDQGEDREDCPFSAYGQLDSFDGEGQNLMIAKYNHTYHWRTSWAPRMDRYFIDLMLDQVRYGSMLNNEFSKVAWNEMVFKFRKEFGPQHDEDDLKSRFLNLRKQFNDMKALLDQSGFSWDEMLQMVTAHGDLWDAYVKEHSDAESYRNKTLPNFNDLYLIYGNGDVPKGESSSSHFMDAKDDDPGVNVWSGMKQTTSAEDDCSEAYAKEDSYPIAFERKILDSWNNDFTMKSGNGLSDGRSRILGTGIEKMGIALIFGEVQSAAMKVEISDHKKKRKPAASPASASKRPQNEVQSAAVKVEISDHQKKRKPPASSASASKRPHHITIKEEIQETFDEKPHIVKGLVGNEEDKDCCSVECIVAALQTIPGMDDALFLKACRVLDDARKAKMFVGMDVTAREKWLCRKLCQ